jgi:hypothetical protein
MVYTAKGVAVLKTTGMTGALGSAKAPLTFVGAAYVRAIFFAGFWQRSWK